VEEFDVAAGALRHVVSFIVRYWAIGRRRAANVNRYDEPVQHGIATINEIVVKQTLPS